MVEVELNQITAEEGKEAIITALTKTIVTGGRVRLDNISPNEIDYAIHLLRYYRTITDLEANIEAAKVSNT